MENNNVNNNVNKTSEQNNEQQLMNVAKGFDKINKKNRIIPPKYNNQSINDFLKSEPHKNGIKYSKNKSQVKLTPNLIDYNLLDYASDSDGKYSQAGITWINPVDFVNLNAGYKTQDMIKNDLKGYDYAKEFESTNGTSRLPFLHYDVNNNRIVGHEGRHRMMALAKNGVKRVPVIMNYKHKDIEDFKYNPERFKNIDIYGDNGNDETKNYKVNFKDIIPLNFDNRDEIMNEFGYFDDDDFDEDFEEQQSGYDFEKENKKRERARNKKEIKDVSEFYEVDENEVDDEMIKQYYKDLEKMFEELDDDL